MPLLDLEGVSKGFPGVLALDDVQTRPASRRGARTRRRERRRQVDAHEAAGGHLTRPTRAVLPGRRGATRSTGPRHAQELGISIIHQEFNLMPDLTVAQNIFIGREQRSAGLFLDGPCPEPARHRRCFDRLGLPLDPASASATSPSPGSRWSRSRRRSLQRAGAHHGRADRGAERGRGRLLFGLIRRFVSPEHRRHLHLPPHAGAGADPDRVTVLRDGRYIDTKVTASDRSQGDHLADGRSRARGRAASGAAGAIAGSRSCR